MDNVSYPDLCKIVSSLRDETIFLRAQLELLTSAATGLEWISRKQAQDLLHVGPTKLWELTTRDRVIVTSGRLVSVTSCRAYLDRGRIDQAEINRRVGVALSNQCS